MLSYSISLSKVGFTLLLYICSGWPQKVLVTPSSSSSSSQLRLLDGNQQTPSDKTRNIKKCVEHKELWNIKDVRLRMCVFFPPAPLNSRYHYDFFCISSAVIFSPAAYCICSDSCVFSRWRILNTSDLWGGREEGVTAVGSLEFLVFIRYLFFLTPVSVRI